MPAQITLEGLDKLVKKLDNLAQLKTVAAAIKAGALHIKGKIAKYPPRRDVPQPFKSERQRRWFFAALRSGEIEVPYRRGQSPGSEALGRKWTVKTRDNGLTAIVGNNVSYGPFVQGEQQASFMAARGWKTTDTVAQEEGDRVNELVAQAVEKALAG